MHRSIAVACLALLSAGALTGCREQGASAALLAATAGGPTQVSRTFTHPVRVSATTEMSGCDNSPGPNITISGAMSIGGLSSRLTFTNNAKGTHTYETDRSVDVSVVPAEGETFSIPKQPVLGGVGGNPFIWIKFETTDGQAVSEEIFLGRCVQGLRADAGTDFGAIADAIARFTTTDCANSPGPTITLDGDLALRSGVNAKLIFQNNDNPVGGPHEANADAVVVIRLVPPGQSVSFPKQPVLGGVGGNPWIWFGFLTPQGDPIGDRALLGRCEQLSKA